MTNMQRLTVVLAFIFAVLLGLLVATTLFGGKTGSSKPSAVPSASLAASTPPASSGPSASSAPVPSASAGPSPTPKPVAAATIQFVQLALDAATDTAGTTRTMAFAGGAGKVTVKLKTESGGSTKACLFADGKQLGCRTAGSGTLTGSTTKASVNYKVTLRGAGSATPVVDVTIAFPATKPKVTITNARFDGTANAAHNGLQVVATPRAAGTYHVTASWGGHPIIYEVDLIEQGGPGLQQVKPTTGATSVSQGFAVTKTHSWMIALRNTETGFGATGLTATYTWP
jgi:hypothetical protein